VDPARDALLKEAEQRVADAEAAEQSAKAHAKKAAEELVRAKTELDFYEAEAKSDAAKARAKRAEAKRLEKEAAARRKNPKRGDPLEAEKQAKEAHREADRLDLEAEQSRDLVDQAKAAKRRAADEARKAEKKTVLIAEKRAAQARESFDVQADLARRIDALEAKYRDLPEVRERPNIEPPTASEAGKLKWEIDSLKRRLSQEAAKGGADAYSRMRAASPGPDARNLAIDNLKELPKELRGLNGDPIDVTTGKELKPEEISPDHLWPLKRVAEESGIIRLTPKQQLKIAELPENYLPMSKTANSSKRERTMEEWFKTQEGSKVPKDLQDMLIKAQERGRARVQEEIQKMIKQNMESSK